MNDVMISYMIVFCLGFVMALAIIVLGDWNLVKSAENDGFWQEMELSRLNREVILLKCKVDELEKRVKL